MKNIRRDIKDHRDRWEEIETLCGCTLRKVHISKVDDDHSETGSLKYAKSSPKPTSSSLKHSQRNSASSGECN